MQDGASESGWSKHRTKCQGHIIALVAQYFLQASQKLLQR